MKLLLDTHFCLWLTLAQEEITASEWAVLLEPNTELAFPSVAIWELNIKWEKRFASGQRKGEASPSAVLRGLHIAEIPAIDLTPELAAATLLHPSQHSDPFDILLLTMAQETGHKLLTRDEQLRGHPLAFHVD